MKALSIRQPWAWLIVNGYKNIENRDWGTSFRGRFLVHASQTMTEDDYLACLLFLRGFTWGPDLIRQMPKRTEFERGGIVGTAVLLDCVTRHASEWFCGGFGFVLDDAGPLHFQPCRGALHFFDVPWPLPSVAQAGVPSQPMEAPHA